MTAGRRIPDLTTNNAPPYQEKPGGPIPRRSHRRQVFNTVFALVVSPRRQDAPGRVGGNRPSLTRDELDRRHPDLPPLGTVNRIEISPHEPGRAFLAVQRYRLDDWRPFIFRPTFRQDVEPPDRRQERNSADHPVRVVGKTR